MAYANKLIRNVKTGQDIKFLQTSADTNGKLLEMETVYHAASKEPPAHYHPYQEEEFLVLEGELTVRINHSIKILKVGEFLHIPKNTTHSMWNSSGKTTIVNWKVYPALDTEYFLETAVGIVANKKTNASGMPSLLQVAAMANKYSNVFRLSSPPFLIQKMLFMLLAPVAYLCGYRSSYKEYLN